MALPRTIACCLLATACSGGAPSDEGAPAIEVEVVTAVDGYVEYQPGTLPIILAAPHGGRLRPAELADRTEGDVVGDAETQELARLIAAALTDEEGSPHLVVNRLHRIKLDANRPLAEAAEGDPKAEEAWHAYHDFIEQAGAAVVEHHGRGLLIDVHGHAHDAQWVELGYLILGSALMVDDEALDALADESSVFGLVQSRNVPLSELLRGPDSFGALLEQAGYRSVPSPSSPSPAGQPYYNGGYTTRRHGSRDGGPIDAIQLEANREGVRDSRLHRVAFAAAMAGALRDHVARFYTP